MNANMSDMSLSAPHEREQTHSIRFAWFIWGLAATFYFSDYMARVAPSVMHQFLQRDFGISEMGFATLTSSFYIPYIIMQIPVGLTVDRISIRTILTIMSLVTAIGCVVFGLSHGLFYASFARVLIGFSAAFAFISALRLATSWFPPAMLGLLAGLTQALGMLGASAGQAPLSFLVGAVGWRSSMFVIAVLFVVLAGLLYCFVMDKPGHAPGVQPSAKKTNLNIFQSLRIVLSSRQTWINAFYAGFLYGPTAVIGEALGPAYLQYGRGLSAYGAAFASGLIFIGWVVGGPITGWLSDKIQRRKPIMIASALCGTLLTSLVVFYPHLDKTSFYILFFIFGLTNSGVAIAYALSTELHSRAVVGTVIAFTNMLSIFVGASLQPLVGRLVDMASGSRAFHVETLTLTDFQFGLQVLPLSSFIALVLAFMIKETYCKAVSE